MIVGRSRFAAAAFALVCAGCASDDYGSSRSNGTGANRAIERGVRVTGTSLWRDYVERPVRSTGRAIIDGVLGE